MNVGKTHSHGKSIGIVLAFCGLWPIAFCYLLVNVAPALKDVEKWNSWLWIGITLVLAGGFFRAAYLSWHRWSPLAIRHVTGASFFLITTVCFLGAPLVVPQGLDFWIAFGTLSVCYVAYRTLAFLWDRSAFPESDETTESKRETAIRET